MRRAYEAADKREENDERDENYQDTTHTDPHLRLSVSKCVNVFVRLFARICVCTRCTLACCSYVSVCGFLQRKKCVL